MQNTKIQFWTRATVFLVALVFIITGIIREEHMVVFKKAVNICLECIGIG